MGQLYPRILFFDIEKKSEKNRNIEDGLLLVVPARIYGKTVRALIDSGATRGFISVDAVTPLGLTTRNEDTFLELGNGQKILSRGKVQDVPVVTAGLTTKIDLTVTKLLHDVDIILGINWLQHVNPLIDWKASRLYLPGSVGTSVVIGNWLDAQMKTGTVQVLYSADQLKDLQNEKLQSSISVIQAPKFWKYNDSLKSSWCLIGSV